jgi:hypothetical protein
MSILPLLILWQAPKVASFRNYEFLSGKGDGTCIAQMAHFVPNPRLAQPLISAAWVMVFWVWFGLQRPPWLPRLTTGLTLLLMVSNILRDEVFFELVPHAVAVHFVTVSLVLRVLFFALLLWVVVEGIRRQGVEGWLVLPLVVLRGISASRSSSAFSVSE